MIKIFTDGGARGNPGPAASAYVVFSNDKIISEKSYFIGESTNNIAEYFAVLMAVLWIKKNTSKYENEPFVIHIDSELVVRQLNGIYKIKNSKLKNIFDKIKLQQASISQEVIFKHILREQNKKADALVNEELDRSTVSR